MTTISVGEYANCLEITSGDFRIAVSQDFGPRILGGFINNGPNIFRLLPNEPMPIGTGFKLYGGHRLWHSPEAAPRSYAPDNNPPKVTVDGDEFTFDCEPEELTGVKKTIRIKPLGNNKFSILHTLTNCGQWPATMAPWGLSVMAPGGTAVIPQGRDASRNPFAPDRSLVLWPYSSISDYRLKLEDEYIFLKQDAYAQKPIKIGFNTSKGWAAYINQGYAFIKSFDAYDPAEIEYPDFGCNLESYSCDKFLELESVAPLYTLDPQESCEHEEIWKGVAGLPEIKNSEDVKKFIEPLIEE